MKSLVLSTKRIITILTLIFFVWFFINQILFSKLGYETDLKGKIEETKELVKEIETKLMKVEIIAKEALKKSQNKIENQYSSLEQQKDISEEIVKNLLIEKRKKRNEAFYSLYNAKDVTSNEQIKFKNASVDPKIACVMPFFDYYNYDRNYIRQSRLSPCNPRIIWFDEKDILHINCSGEIELKEHAGGWSDWKILKENTKETNVNGEIMAIQCKDGQWDYATRCSPKIEAFDRAKKYIKEKKINSDDLFNVAIVGMDSVSRAQFYRKLRRSTALLHSDALNYKVYDFEYYNVMGDGTLKCLVPLLVGYDAEDKKHLYNGWRSPDGKTLDEWPWVWYDGAEHGYVSLYGEDFCPGVFSLNLLGWRKSPSDHTMSHLFCSGLPISKRNHNTHGTCIGSRYAHTHHFDFIKSFLKNYEGVGRMSYNHLLVAHEESLAEVEVVDKDLTVMIRDMDEYFSDNTVFIILGDHGPRYGSYRQTLQGKLEERLPILVFLVPPKLLEKFPNIKENLEINVKRLVTAFDLHETILSILKLGQPGLTFPKKDNNGISIFEYAIPKNRTCVDAGIELHWCACLGWEDVKVSDNVIQNLAQFLIESINEKTGNGEGVCAKLSIENIDSAQIQNLGQRMRTYNIRSRGESDRWNMDTKLNAWNYRIQIKVQPGDAVFEGIIEVDSDKNKKIKQISRISKYSHQQTCSGPFKPSYCVCKNWLEGKAENKDNIHLLFEKKPK